LLIDIDEETLSELFNKIDSSPNSEQVPQYFNLFQSGTHILTDDKPLEVDYAIPIQANHQKGFLLSML